LEAPLDHNLFANISQSVCDRAGWNITTEHVAHVFSCGPISRYVSKVPEKTNILSSTAGLKSAFLVFQVLKTAFKRLRTLEKHTHQCALALNVVVNKTLAQFGNHFHRLLTNSGESKLNFPVFETFGIGRTKSGERRLN